MRPYPTQGRSHSGLEHGSTLRRPCAATLRRPFAATLCSWVFLAAVLAARSLLEPQTPESAEPHLAQAIWENIGWHWNLTLWRACMLKLKCLSKCFPSWWWTGAELVQSSWSSIELLAHSSIMQHCSCTVASNGWVQNKNCMRTSHAHLWCAIYAGVWWSYHEQHLLFLFQLHWAEPRASLASLSNHILLIYLEPCNCLF